MNTYMILVEDRAECGDRLFYIQANSLSEAKEKFCKAFMPIITFPYENLENMLSNEDVYLHIVEPHNVINL